MLYEIYCDEFYQKQIRFNPGLSVVLGTNTGHNSIGKSTFLLIVDFVFGGTTYSASQDIIKNVDRHDICFTFRFGKESFYFCRNNIDSNKVWICNDKYDKVSELSLEDYTQWLNSKYGLNLPELSFRDAVGRYIRVYGKQNCDERHPLHYIPKEKAEKASIALLKLFDEYLPLKECEEAAKRAKEDANIYKKAQTREFVAKITGTQFKKNLKDLETINADINDLASELEQGILDVEASATEEAIELKRLLTQARRMQSKLKSRYDLLTENGNYAFSASSESFEDLRFFFPDVRIAHLQEIEDFHRTISNVFKEELQIERNKIAKDIDDYDIIIKNYEEQLQGLIKNPKLSKVVLEKYSSLLRGKEKKERENEEYKKSQQLKQAEKTSNLRLKNLKQEQFALVSNSVNQKMHEINNSIYEGSRNAPILSFTDTGYQFFTPDDTGTGMAYKGLVVYDLAVLSLTKLPLIVHDSVVLKQISDDAVEHIVELYSTCGKQVIIALDKQDSYSEKTYEMLNNAAVLRLADGGEELFGRSWG